MNTKQQNLESLKDIHHRFSETVSLNRLTGEDERGGMNESSARVTSLVTDSRRVTPGSAFFAIRGLRANGEEFIDEAIHRGAQVLVGEDLDFDAHPGVAKVQVADSRKALAKMARRYHGYPDKNIKVVGITGTNGKTTVSTLTRHLLEEPGKPVGLIGTVKYHLGDRELPSFRTTPEASDLYPMLRSMLAGGCSEAVMEVSSHGIHQSRVAEMEMEVVTFLNLTRDHLDYHSNMESYFREKRKIFNGENGSLPKVAIINGDCPYGQRLMEELPPQVRVLSFGLEDHNLFRAKNINLEATGTEFLLESPEGSMVIKSPLLGRYNIMNLLAALSILHAMGRSIPDAIRKIGAFEGVDGRMETVDDGQPYNVVVDYAHTPDALRNALGMLRECTEGKLHLVFGCGGDRDKGKRLEMTRVACAGADQVWATADNPRTESLEDIFKDMKKGQTRGAKISFIDDRRRAISLALDQANKGDCVLIAGKGHECFQEVQYTAIPFDDRKVAKELIQVKSLTC
ncbi:MAG: UDP-N-acetylmuramoyl-L-alanyl-D-glutamate--2,6-diaminopimelate ligase [Opitutales bacterium]|nr:UDP-N-acetylmuramoyl-L-alanyl-D-glutamate--2,6-diaminopimelate ligase [Opitutales bacterium]